MRPRIAAAAPTALEVLAGVIITLYAGWPFLRRGRYVTGFDTYAYSGPALRTTLDALRHGRVPGWNSEVFGGAPQLANSQLGALSPLKVLAMPFDLAHGLSVLVFVNLALFVSGMAVLARRSLGLGRIAGVVVMIISAFAGATQGRLILHGQIDVIAWTPWVLVAADHVLAARRPVRGTCALAIATAMMLMAGHPQAAYIMAPLVVLLVVARAADGRAWRRLPCVGAGATLGVLLAAPQLIPTLLLTGKSALTGGRALSAVANSAYVLAPNRLLVGVLGDFRSANPIGLTGNSESAAYLGVAAVVLAAIGWSACRRRSDRVGDEHRLRWTSAAASLVGVVALALAVGPRAWWYRFAFRVVPGFDQARVPGRWAMVAVPAAAILAGIGTNELMADRADRDHDHDHDHDHDEHLDRARVDRQVVLRALALIGTLLAVILVGGREILPASLVVQWVAVVLAIVLATRLESVIDRRGGGIAGHVTGLAIIAVLLVELGLPTSRSVARSLLQDTSFTGYRGSIVDALEGRPGRVLSLAWDEFDQPRYMASTLRPNANGLFGLRSIDGYDGGLQVTKRWVGAMRFLGRVPFDKESPLRSQIRVPVDADQLARLGVRYVIVETRVLAAIDQVPGWRGPIAVEGGAQLWENPRWRGEGQLWFATEPATSAILDTRRGDPSWWASNDALATLDGPRLSCAKCAPMGLDIMRPHDGAIDTHVITERNALLTVSEQFADGWSVAVDGRRARPVEADGFLLAVAVPTGTHDVEFSYTPPGWHLGLVGALIAVLTMITAVGIDGSQRRRSGRRGAGRPVLAATGDDEQ